MNGFNNALDRVKIAAPCTANWDEMPSFEGARVRFCAQCNLNVYNLSGMTRREATALVANAEGRLCVRFYRRADGTILTQDCPVGLRALQRRVAWVAQVLLGMAVSLLAGVGLPKLAEVVRPILVLEQGGIAPPLRTTTVEERGDLVVPVAELGEVVMPERLTPRDRR